MSRPIPIPTPKPALKSQLTEWPDNTAPSRSVGPSFSKFFLSSQSSPLPSKNNATNIADELTDVPSLKNEDSDCAADTSSCSSSEGFYWELDMNMNAGKARSTTAVSGEENWATDMRLDLHNDRMVGRRLPKSDSTVVVGVGNTEEQVDATDEIRKLSEVPGTCPPLSCMRATERDSSVPAGKGDGGGSASRDRLPTLVERGWLPGNSGRY